MKKLHFIFTGIAICLALAFNACSSDVAGPQGEKGEQGDSCKLKQLDDGYKIICGSDTLFVPNGKDGKDGQDGADGEKGDKV